MISASIAHAQGHMHVQNIRNFPRTKLDSEINVPFLSNKHGDPHFFSVFAKEHWKFEEEKKV